MSSFLAYLIKDLKDLKEEGLLRTMEPVRSGCLSIVEIENRSYINFSSNNYLGLNGHPIIVKAMQSAIERWGTSTSASRLIVGNLSIFEEAEEYLASFKKMLSALIFPSGFQANVTVISTLAGEDDEIFSDELNHASIIDGCRLSKAKVSIYRHRDVNHLEDLLKRSKGKKKLIVTDSVFSMDGDIAPLREIVSLAERFDAFVIIDDAHATGVLGKEGRGSLEYFQIKSENVMVLGTGGKALGVGGAFFCCPKVVKDYLINKGRGFIYTTGPIPAIPAGLISAIDLVMSEPERRVKLSELAEYFHGGLKGLGFETIENPSHILPLIVGNNEKVIRVAEELRKGGIFVKAIRTPTVPKGRERIRFSLTAEHKREDIDKVLEILQDLRED